MMNNLQSSAFVAKTTQLLSSVARLRLLLVMFLTLTVTTNAWGEETETITASDATYTNSTHTWSQTSCTVVQSKGNAFDAVNSSYPNRWYKGHEIAFTPKSGYTITKIVLVGSSDKYNGQTMEASAGTINSSSNTTTWTGNITSSSSVTLTMGKQFRFGSVTITYTSSGGGDPVDPYTVTLNAGPGTCAASVTETSAGAGVTLPTPTLDGCDEWSFAGWATSAVATETSSKPATLLTGTYKPTSNITLYAVYQRTEETEGNGGTENVSRSYTFSNFTAGTQYAKNEEHKLDNDVTLTTTYCHFTSELRIYSSSTYNGYVVSNKLPGRIVSIGFNAGYKVDAIDVFGSTNGTDWTKVGQVSVTSTSYKDYTLNFGTTNYTYFKLDVAGSNQVRLKSITITWESTSAGGTIITTYYHSTPDCGAPCTDAVTISKGTENNGTFTLSTTGQQSTCDGPVIVTVSNIQPATGYQLSEITQSGVDAAKVIIDNNNKTVTYAKNTTGTSTIDVTFTPKEYTLPLVSSLSCVTNGSVTFAYNATSATTFTAATRTDYICTGYWSAPSGGVQVLNADGSFAANDINDFITDGKWINTTATKLTPRWETEYKMILSKGTEENGTYTLSTTNIETSECATSTTRQVTITATPYAGYEVDQITYNGDGTASIISGPTLNTGKTTWVYAFAKNDKGEGTFIVTFKSLPQYTVTWLANEQVHHTQTAVKGTTLQIPSKPTDGSYSCDDKVFVGWTATPISGTIDDEPADLFTTKNINVEDAATTYYAVFASVGEGGGNGNYIKVTSEPTDWSGDYLIVANGNCFDGSRTTIDANGNYQAVTISNNEIASSNTTDSYIVSISKSTNIGKYYIKTKSGYYIGSTATSNNELLNSTTIKYDNTISISGNDVTIKGTNSIFRFYVQSGQTPRFRYYKSSTNTTLPHLYKKSSGTFYSDYTTTCDATKAKVTYDLNGGEYESDDCVSQTVTKGQPFNLCSNTPTKEGYTFAGWSDGTKTYAAGAEVTISESTTFYASWKANTITITWDLNYTDSPEAETSTYIYDGENIDMPEDPTRVGYKFDGWYTASIDGTKITEVGETNKPTSNVTYYAHWAELYTVTFMASGQVYVKQEHKYLSGDALELPNDPSAANFACDGYLFEGWSKYQQTKEDANRPELVDANTTIENDLELHAVWKKASTSGAGTQIFYESFDTEEGSGANDGDWGNDVGTETLVNDTWNFANGYGAYHCVKLGSSKNRGSATTPTLTQLSGDAKLSFKAAAWVNNNETTTLNLSISGGGTLTPTSVTMVKGAWTTYEVQIKDGTPSSKITFEAANASNNRFFLDEVIITTSGSYNYTTVPNCGPTMVAKENVWGTSANGQSVKVNVPIGVKMFEGKATVTGTSTNENFVVNTLENVGNGEHNVVVVYTPTAEDIKENTTITLTAKNGEEIWSTTTFTLHGRSLPAEFVVVANKGDKNYALPANMPEAGTYAGFEVQVNGDEVIAAPKSHLYNLCAVHSTRYGENGTAVRLVGNDNACLWASSAAKSTDIRNWAKTDNAKATNYEWSLYTEDGDTYRISSTAVTEEGRVLRYNGDKFGMYKEGTDLLRLLPVGCSSTPLNVQVSPARVSAIVSWTNAGACELVVKQGGVTVVTLPSATSPAQVSNLAESTAYTFMLIPNDDASCGVSGTFTTTGPTIDIVEWETDGIVIQVDKDDELNPKVVIKGEEEHGDAGGNIADELFFSKYFEAHAENKLLAIYNGTAETIDLLGYEIKSENGTLDLSQFGQTKGFVAPNEEIILVYYDAQYSAEECAETQEGYESWNILFDKSVLAFSGRGSLGLYKNDVLIDVIGSTYPSGELTKIGKSVNGSECADEDVQLYVDEGDGSVSVNDQSSFFCTNGDNIKTTEVETDYGISTNRCLLIRKNSVTSGENAVNMNKATAGSTCGDLSKSFITLCSEWSGFRIGSGRSSDSEIKTATCEGLGYVGGFDYNNYYRTLHQIGDATDLENFEHDDDDDENTYFISIEDLAKYSCLNIQLQLTDGEGNVLTEQTSQVPILVTGEKFTTDPIFSAIVKDSKTEEADYETSKIRCSTCDVVILENATLTKSDADTENDINQVRDIYVYPGGRLIVPTAATDFSVNNISMRRVQDDVATANVEASLLITSSSKTPVYVDVRVSAENWHWFTLPYDCNIADVSWVDGSKPKYNADWFLMYYDGNSRANEQSIYENHWKVYQGTTIEAGKGYIIGITGHPSKSKVKYELRFPMSADVLTGENEKKSVPLYAWGVDMDITPNKKGWNLVGNPYLDYYKTSENISFKGLSLIKYGGIDSVTGDRLYDDSGNIPFLVSPVDGGWYEYKQELASEVEMNPFTAYFVQVGDPANENHTDGMELHAEFVSDHRGRMSLIRRAPQDVDGEQEPVIVRVEVANAKGESDKTTLIIDDRFTNEYEMNGDFFKWFGDYYRRYTKPVLYSMGADHGKRAFNALSEQLAAQPVALGMFAAQAGDYTFSLTRKRCDLSSVEEVWLYDATTATYTNLMQQDYTFTTAKTEGEGRFYLSVKMKQKTPTAVENVNGNLSLVAHLQTLVLSGLPAEAQVWVYDATGKLLHSEHTTAYQRIYPVQQAGVYFVSVKGQGDAQTLSTIVK